MLGLLTPDAGSVLELDGTPLPARVTRRNDEQVKSLQIVFQNPDSALNRAHSVKRLIGRALSRLAALRGAAKDERLATLTDAVRLPDRYLGSRTRQLSGGLKQRVAIARAFAGEPRVVVCDEPTSALDVSVQAAILNLLADLQRERGVSYVFISHDLHVVRYLSDRIAVLYLGRLLEIGPAAAVFDGPHHPYTEALLSSVPALDAATATANASACPAICRARRAAFRLRVPYALPAQARGDLRAAGPTLHRCRRRAPDPLPHSRSGTAHAAKRAARRVARHLRYMQHHVRRDHPRNDCSGFSNQFGGVSRAKRFTSIHPTLRHIHRREAKSDGRQRPMAWISL